MKQTTGRSPLRLLVAVSAAALALFAIADSRPALAVIEDFTTWTEVDSGSDITVTASNLAVDTMSPSAVSHVTSDLGAGAIGDFNWFFELNVTTFGGAAQGGGLAAAANAAGTIGNHLGSNDAVGLFMTSGAGGFKIRIYDYTDNSLDDSIVLSTGTDYFIEFSRSSTTITAIICTVSHSCGTPVDTITTTATADTYRYAHAVHSRGSLSGDDTYDLSNMDLTGVSDTITITSHATGDKFQRVVASNDKQLTISGTYVDATDPPTAIEVRFDGGLWSTLDSSPAGGTFSGTVTLSAGQGLLEVRMADDTAVTDSVSDFGIGDIFMLAGQSNMVNPATNNQSYTGSLGSSCFEFPADNWSGTPAVCHGGAKSPWPEVANQIEALEGSPVFFIATAVGATNLSAPVHDWQIGDTVYEDAVQQIIDSGVNDVLAILWHQGESDIASVVAEATHNAAVDTLISSFQGEGGAISDSPLLAASVAEYASKPDADVSAIRDAIQTAWGDNADVLEGPSLYDVDLAVDGLHFKSDANIAILADRWVQAIAYHFYGGTEKSPAATGYSYSTDLTKVYIDYDQNVTVADATTAAWNVVDNGGNQDANITDISASGARVTITFSPALVLPITVDLGYGNQGAGSTVPLGTGATTLPAVAFTGESASAESFAATFNVTYEAAPSFNAALPLLFIVAGFAPIAAGFWLLWTFKRREG